MPVAEGLVYIILLAISALTGALVAKLSPFYRGVLAVDLTSNRFRALDGLRGVLALSVFVHHSQFAASYYSGRGWEMPHQSFSFMIGNVSVAVFFMITGFLFWSKAIVSQGRVLAWPLYVSRFRRIYPMFLFSLAVSVILIAIESKWTLRESPWQVSSEVGRSLFVGVLGFPRINNGENWLFPGVNWSLQYETWFYLLLPALAPILWKQSRFLVIVPLLMVSLLLVPDYVNYPNILTFVLGGVAAYVVIKWEKPLTISADVELPILATILAFLCWASYHTPSYTWRFIAFPIFLAVLYDATFGGMLTSRPWRLLGMISYSIYLMHIPIIYICLGVVDRWWSIDSLSGLQLLAVFSGCAAIVVIVSSMTYRLLEHPFIIHYRSDAPNRASGVAPMPPPKRQTRASA